MDPASWKIAEQDGNKVLSLFKNSTYSPPVRSPLNFALIRDVFVGDFVLELRMQSAKKEYPHLDLCLFFGYQDPTHFYYAHIAAVADPLAHSVTVVDGKPRVSIVKERTQGVKWGTGWHKVRLERKVADGTVKVFFDDMTKPVMTAEDKRFAWGRVGVGSFDDLGNFDDVKLWGIKVEPPKEKKEAQ
jgi:hypothetical protein